MLDRLAILETYVRARNLAEAARILRLSAGRVREALDDLSIELGVELIDPFDRPTKNAKLLAVPAFDILEASHRFFDLAESIPPEIGDCSTRRGPASRAPDPLTSWNRKLINPAIAVTDLAGKYLRVGSDFSLMVGREPRDMIGVGFQFVTHEGDLAADRVQDDALVTGRLHNAAKVKRYVTPQGVIRTASVTVAKVVDGSEEVLVVHAAPVNEPVVKASRGS